MGFPILTLIFVIHKAQHQKLFRKLFCLLNFSLITLASVFCVDVISTSRSIVFSRNQYIFSFSVSPSASEGNFLRLVPFRFTVQVDLNLEKYTEDPLKCIIVI